MLDIAQVPRPLLFIMSMLLSNIVNKPEEKKPPKESLKESDLKFYL
jgi:hypothetical protein